MADNPDGLLSQDDINAALAAAGLTPDVPGEVAAAPAATPAPAPAANPAPSSPAQAPAVPAPAPPQPPAKDTRVDATGRPFDAVAAAMAAAIEAEAAAAPPASAPPSPKPAPFDVPELQTANTAAVQAQGIDLLRDVELDVKIELGRSRMLIDDVLRLTEGSVVELDKLAGDPVDVFVNDRLVARGEVLVLNDNFCVRIGDIVKDEQDEAH